MIKKRVLGSFSFWGFSKGLGARISLVSNGPHTESKGILEGISKEYLHEDASDHY